MIYFNAHLNWARETFLQTLETAVFWSRPNKGMNGNLSKYNRVSYVVVHKT